MKNIIINKNAIKDTLFSLYQNGAIRVLFLIVLIIVAITIFSTVKNVYTDKNRFGQLVYQQNSLTSSPLPQSVEISYSLGKNVGQKIPAVINVYRPEDLSEEELLNKFDSVSRELMPASKHKIITDRIGKTYYKETPGSSFAGSFNTGYFTFLGKSEIALSTKTAEGAGRDAWSFLTKSGLNKNLSSEPTKEFYRKAGDEITLSDEKNGSYLLLSFLPKIAGFSVFGIGEAGGLVSLLIDRASGTIIKFQYFNPAVNTKNLGSYQTRDINSLNKLQLSEYRVAELTDKQGGQSFGMDLASLKKINITEIALSYFISSQKQNLLLPVYVLTGSVVAGAGREGKVILYLPAAQNFVFSY